MKRKVFIEQCLKCYYCKLKKKPFRCSAKGNDNVWYWQEVHETPLYVKFSKLCDEEKEKCEEFVNREEGESIDEERRIELKEW